MSYRALLNVLLPLGLSACLNPDVPTPPAPPPPSSTCPARPTNAISGVQGSGATSPLVGQTVTVEGVVVADFQGTAQLGGFNLQGASDNDAATSDAVFVNDAPLPSPVDVKSGDRVQVEGGVIERDQQTMLDAKSVTVCGVSSLPAPTSVTFPLASPTALEAVEGMLVSVPTTITVTETFYLGRYGALSLSSGGRIFNPTNGQGGDAASNALRALILDDARVGQNPTPIPYLSASGTDGTRRVGDTVVNLTGVIGQSRYQGASSTSNSDPILYRLQPTGAVNFTASNPRPVMPPSVGGTVKVASVNVLNFFTTLNRSSADPACTNPVSGSARGAESCLEFDRQRAKLVALLKGLDADVVGLTELERNGTGASSAVQNLVDALNAAVGAGTYQVIPDPAQGVGTDAIKVGMIYKPSKLAPLGVSISDPNAAYSRPPVAQTFRTLGVNAGSFTLVVNHFKSKGSCPAAGTDQPNQDNGQGCWTQLRLTQAEKLKAFVESLKTRVSDPDALVIGDLNSYGQEDPINFLASTGSYTPTGTGSSAPISNPNAALENLDARIPLADRYSYVFDGSSGTLDYGLASASFSAAVSGATHWHVNSDEPGALDYNTNFKTDDRYAPNAFRSSDHDPLLIGLSPAPDATAAPAP